MVNFYAARKTARRPDGRTTLSLADAAMSSWGNDTSCPDPTIWDCGNGNMTGFIICMSIIGGIAALACCLLCSVPVLDSLLLYMKERRGAPRGKWIAMV
jgi:hypothetical protein